MKHPPDPVGVVFAALADGTRRQVVSHLSAQGPTTPTQLAGLLPITRQAVAKHLAALSEAGLVSVTRSGREARYRLTPAPLAAALAWMIEVGAEWDRRLDASARYSATRTPDRTPGSVTPS
ncbi:MAG: ArsR/SmtB family transcription factor [Egibacteraceae bacterium]